MTTTTTLSSVKVDTVQEMEDALDALMSLSPIGSTKGAKDATYICHDAGTITLALEEEVLTDGSKVYNIRISAQ